jgi:hypothetical protein
MIVKLTVAARVVPLTALILAAYASKSAYEQQDQELQQAYAQYPYHNFYPIDSILRV